MADDQIVQVPGQDRLALGLLDCQAAQFRPRVLLQYVHAVSSLTRFPDSTYRNGRMRLGVARVSDYPHGRFTGPESPYDTRLLKAFRPKRCKHMVSGAFIRGFFRFEGLY